MDCHFEQRAEINFQKLRNQAFNLVEKTRSKLGEESTKSHINAVILMWTMDLMLNRKSLKFYQNNINELIDGDNFTMDLK
jgi:hypothetical protein